MANPIRSGLSTEESYVLFVNKTVRKVNLYWIDYHGQPSYYTTLDPDDTSKVNTFRSHPWIFRDNRTGERLHVSHQNTFWPKPYLMRDPRNLSNWIPCRKQIAIHLPVRTLRDICLWTVMDILTEAAEKRSQRNCRAVEASTVNTNTIDCLFLPRTIKTDLHYVLNTIETHGERL